MSQSKVGVVDCGFGNIDGVVRAIRRVGMNGSPVSEAASAAAVDALVIPGVGAFGACAQSLALRGFTSVIKSFAAEELPVLGICVGAQVLLGESEEDPGQRGLGLIQGRVKRLSHGRTGVGWAQVRLACVEDPVSSSLAHLDNSFLYFSHNYTMEPEDPTCVLMHYGDPTVNAAVTHGSLTGVQFHPERSQGSGLRFLYLWSRLHCL